MLDNANGIQRFLLMEANNYPDSLSALQDYMQESQDNLELSDRGLLALEELNKLIKL